MIKVEKLSRSFGKTKAVRNISLSVGKGCIYGLVGPDGAGKTTTLRMLAGVVDADSGIIEIMGKRDLGSGYVKDRVGYMPQRFSLPEDMTVWENIRFFGAMYGIPSRRIKEKGEGLLAMMDLLSFKERLAGRLSGGMKQKLALCSILMHEPELLILDEPGTGVDPVSRREFWRALYRLNKDGKTVILSTPYMDEAELCTHISFMYAGEIIADGTPKSLCGDFPYSLLKIRPSTNKIRSIVNDCGFHDVNAFGDALHIAVADTQSAELKMRNMLASAKIGEWEMKAVAPTLEDVFVELVRSRE